MDAELHILLAPILEALLSFIIVCTSHLKLILLFVSSGDVSRTVHVENGKAAEFSEVNQNEENVFVFVFSFVT